MASPGQTQPSTASVPKLPLLDLSSPHTYAAPTKRIHDGPDVSTFLTSLAYRDIGIFLLQLNHALVPRHNPSSAVPRVFNLPSTSSSSATPSVKALQDLLSTVETYIDEAPPDPGPRRFGNVSFRQWFGLLEQRVDSLFGGGLLGDITSIGDGGAKTEIVSYFMGSWGSSQRLDFGTGHELSFLAFLACLWKLGFFKDGEQNGDIEREIVLGVIERYLAVVRKLILAYTLEPAGSHGVWGLDDHFFLPYIFGSAQLSRPINSDEPTPIEGSVRGAPRPASVTQPSSVEDYRHTNMYFSAIGFINDVKKGPFWEHSPILFDVSGIRDGWGKINKGMIKMFNAEVLSKFPVVQHFPFGSLLSWDHDPEASVPAQSVHMVNQPVAAAATASATAAAGGGATGHPAVSAGTGAPWAQATRMPPTSGPGVPYSRIPPGPSSGSLASRQPNPAGTPANGNSTGPQMTVTRAPWARNG